MDSPESPIECCAAPMSRMPMTVIGAAIPMGMATAKPIFAHQCGVLGWAWRRSPPSPVRRRWYLHPKASDAQGR